MYTASPHSVNQANTQFYFGATQGTVLYSGSSGFPGLMQINVTIPTNVTTGCGVTVAAIVNGVPSNFGPIPIDSSQRGCRMSLIHQPEIPTTLPCRCVASNCVLA